MFELQNSGKPNIKFTGKLIYTKEYIETVHVDEVEKHIYEVYSTDTGKFVLCIKRYILFKFLWHNSQKFKDSEVYVLSELQDIVDILRYHSCFFNMYDDLGLTYSETV